MNDQYPLALPVGTVLAGQYVIERVLGEGGFGITYYASDHKSGGKVAIKEYFPDSMATRMKSAVVPYTGDRGDSYEYGKECFLQEAKTLAQFIGNENIVRIYSLFEENGTAYYVMDYVEGMSFDAYITKNGGKLSFEETIKILAPIMEALSLVHSRGIIHRDVTPDNIFITNDGMSKLLDFGAARYSLGDKSQSLDVILKHGFAPKEQYVRRGKQGPFTDVYALGATFYYAMTGKRPPDSIERMDVDELVPPSSLGVDIPKEAEQALLMALSVQPADRFQSMQSFRSALGQIPQNVIKPTVQRFFTAPESNGSVSGSYFNNKTEGISQNNTKKAPAIVINGVDCVSKGRDILSKARTVIESNIRIIEYLTIGMLIIFLIPYGLLLPDFSEVFSDEVFSELHAAYKLLPIIIIITLLESIILAIAVFKRNKKVYIFGLGTKIIELVLCLTFTVMECASTSETCFYLALYLAEIAIAVLLIMTVAGKRIQPYALYALGVVPVFLEITSSGMSLDILDAFVFIMLTTIITLKGGERNGFN